MALTIFLILSQHETCKFTYHEELDWGSHVKLI